MRPPIMCRLFLALACAFAPLAAATAQTAFFDLTGPDLEATVERGGASLPLATLPALAAGDTLSLRARFPQEQAEQYILVLAFLRGPTNPPPESWFHRARTWRPREDRLQATVPEGAEQAVLFLAPNTGGGFDAIKDAVRGRPGIFVRAARDLGQASLDRARLDAFVASVQTVADRAPERVQPASALIARSLAVQLDAECLRRRPRSQAACLTQSRDSIVLYNSRGTSLAETLTGAPADLAYRVSTTPVGGAGAYSPYISVVRDIGRLLGAFQTAEYQYIPALTVAHGERSGLLLNTPPSFAAPQSVMVAALPPIGAALAAPPRIAAPPGAICLAEDGLTVPVDDAPLLFASRYARALTLAYTDARGSAVALPLVADPTRGGLVVVEDTEIPVPAEGERGTLRGFWGFERFEGPTVRLARPGGDWRLAEGQSAGGTREQAIRLIGGASACVESVTLRAAGGRETPVAWTAQGDMLAVDLPAGSRAGLAVRQYGLADPVVVALGSPTPRLALLDRTVDRPAARGLPLLLPADGPVPAGARLTFSVRAEDGARLRADDAIEVAAASGDSVRLTAGAGFTLQDPTVAVATVDPAAALGASAFGPLRFRLLRADAGGPWQPLGTLVRLPEIAAIVCTDADMCNLAGSNLFLLETVTPGDGAPVAVPSGFTGTSLHVPRPGDGRLHLRLRDAPDVPATVDVAGAAVAPQGGLRPD